MLIIWALGTQPEGAAARRTGVLVSHLTPLLTLTHDRESDKPLVSAAFGLYALFVAALLVLITRPST